MLFATLFELATVTLRPLCSNPCPLRTARNSSPRLDVDAQHEPLANQQERREELHGPKVTA